VEDLASVEGRHAQLRERLFQLATFEREGVVSVFHSFGLHGDRSGKPAVENPAGPCYH
jgi:hypothetical protein